MAHKITAKWKVRNNKNNNRKKLGHVSPVGALFHVCYKWTDVEEGSEDNDDVTSQSNWELFTSLSSTNILLLF